MASGKTKGRKLTAGFGPVQAAGWLGIAVWQFEAAVSRELILPADLGDRWSATLVEAAAERLPEILAQVGEYPPIGANRAAERLGRRLNLDIDRVDIEVLVERDLLAIVGHYKNWPLYNVLDLDRLVDEWPEVLAGIVAERRAWQAASLHPRDARAQLGWWREEFERVAAERGIQPGRSGRFARTDIDNLASDKDLCAQVSADRLLGPDQACEHLEICRADFEQLGLLGLIAPKTTRWMRVGRYQHATVPLYCAGDLDALRDVAGLDWEALRRDKKGEPSTQREPAAGRIPAHAQIMRRFAADLGDRFGIEVWVHHNGATGQWEIDWEELEPGKPGKAQILEAITTDGVIAQHCPDIVLSTNAGAAIRWARNMLEPGAACLLDTETADLKAGVCEIAVIDAASGETLLNTMVNPGMAISQGAFRIHGISDADVASAPTLPDVLPELLRITGNRKILAYNADYDLRVIRSNCHRYDLDPGHLGDHRNWGCVMSHRSDWLRTSRWRPLDGGHRALADCLSALDVLRGLTTPPPWH